ncbi:MAG: PHP domain-containing protein [Kiritimatiellae bacterium]|nr:PHP domain-containing protein [Kiritimatiellia bacterium]
MIDLHVHSTASDGTCTPEELAERGRPFTVMALTDHDNTDGCARFLAACGRDKRDPPAGVRLPGIELSVEPGVGYGQFHMLGLGIDPDAPCLSGFLARIRAGREERNVRMVERLTSLGLPVTMDEVRRHAGGEIVARPHIARVLVEKGYAKSLNDAFARYVGKGGLAYVSRYRPSQEEAIEVIHAAHGAAVMAHPRFWTSDARLLAEGFARLKDLGLDGVEAVYQANLPLETPMHLRLARAAGLAVTAGSDFHGANKSAITLGMDVEDEESFLAPLFAALAKRGSHFVK